MKRACAVALLVLCGCVSQPQSYAPPMQRNAYSGPDTRFLKHFIAMNDPHAMEHVLRDVGDSLQSESWRWTGKRPLFRFLVPATSKLRLVWDFNLPDEVMGQVKPLTIRYTVNGHELDKVVYPAAGMQHFEKAVPAEWLVAGEDTMAGAELDKIFIAPEDKVQLGLALARVGFRD
ncbi:MAG: hypothetical protein U0Q16_22455 [Bryobacteraceae bacterium]